MKRTLYLLGIAVLMLSLFAFQSLAISDDPFEGFPEVTLVYSTGTGPDAPFCQGAQKLSDMLSEITNGRLKINCYFLGSLGLDTTSETDALIRGTIDMTPGSSTLVDAQAPYMRPFTAAYLYESFEHYRKVMESQLWADSVERLVNDLGIRFLHYDYFGVRHLNLRGTRKIEKPEDMKGVKLRMPNQPSYIFIAEKVLGANAVGMSFADVYQALQTGTIDGQENDLPQIWSNKLYEVTDSITLTGHLITTHCIMVNEDKWQSLPQAYRDLINSCWKICSEWVCQTTLLQEQQYRAKLEAEGLVIYDIDKTPFIERATEAYENYPLFHDYLDIYKQIKDMK